MIVDTTSAALGKEATQKRTMGAGGKKTGIIIWPIPSCVGSSSYFS